MPPSPQVDPWGEGFTKSKSATVAPKSAASFEAARPNHERMKHIPYRQNHHQLQLGHNRMLCFRHQYLPDTSET